MYKSNDFEFETLTSNKEVNNFILWKSVEVITYPQGDVVVCT